MYTLAIVTARISISEPPVVVLFLSQNFPLPLQLLPPQVLPTHTHIYSFLLTSSRLLEAHIRPSFALPRAVRCHLRRACRRDHVPASQTMAKGHEIPVARGVYRRNWCQYPVVRVVHLCHTNDNRRKTCQHITIWGIQADNEGIWIGGSVEISVRSLFWAIDVCCVRTIPLDRRLW